MAKIRVAVMFGGRSAEHEISVITGLQVIQAFDTEAYEIVPVYLAQNGKWYSGEKLLEKAFYSKLPDAFSQVDEVALLPDPSVGGMVKLPSRRTIPLDVCFLAFHGQFGEDGCVQGLLELADIPYTGCSVCSSAVSMNKFLSKSILQAHGIPTLPSVLVTKREAIKNIAETKEKVCRNMPYPLFVKPNHLGSSIGISKVTDDREFYAALAKVFQYDEQALIEPLLETLLELNVAVLDGDPPKASVPEIPIAKEGALSYEDKYLRGGDKSTGGQSAGMASLSRVIDPIDLDPKIKERLVADSLHAFRLLNCGGVCRFDFMLDTQSNILYFNEVNPIPGSFSFYLWDKSQPQLLFTDLVSELIKGAVERKCMQRSLNKNFGFHALKGTA